MNFLALFVLSFVAAVTSAPVGYLPPASDSASAPTGPGPVVGQSVNPIRTSFDDELSFSTGSASGNSGDSSLASDSGFNFGSGDSVGSGSSSGFSASNGVIGSDSSNNNNQGSTNFVATNSGNTGSAFSANQGFTGFSASGSGFGGALGNSGNVISARSGAIGSSNFGSGVGSGPQYDEHVFPRSGPVPVTSTIVNQVTKTHTLRVPSTSDVWVTSVKMVKVPVTQLSTERRYVPGQADVVTSFVRITQTPVSIITRTAEAFPTKTMVSVFTRFETVTKNIEFWQPIEHRATNYEVMTVPVLQTQTLLQRVFTTVTVTSTVDATSVRQMVLARSGPVHTYGYF